MERLKLNIQLFASGSASTNIYSPASSSYPYILSMSWTETGTNVDGNYSTISYTATLYGKNIGFSATTGGTLSFQYWDANQSKWVVANSKTINSLTKGNSTSVTGTFNLPHKADGTQYINCLAYWEKTGSNSYIPNSGESRGVDTGLTTIPRATSIGNVTGTIGSASTISWTRASSSFTHRLRYDFGSLTNKTIASNLGTSYSWTIPTSFYAEIPNAKSGTGKLYLDTYSGSTLIGTKTSTLTAKCNETSCKPTVTIAVEDIDTKALELTGDKTKLISGVSDAKCTITRSVKNSATLKTVTINNTSIGTSATTYTATNTTTGKFTCSVTDSRGYSNSATKELTVIPYVAVTISPKIERNTPTDGKINVSYSGNYFNDTFGAVENTLQISYRYKDSDSSTWGEWINLNPTISGNKYSQNGIQLSDMDYEKNFDFQFKAVDQINTSGYIVNKTVMRGIPIFWWNKESFTVEGNLFSTKFPATLHGGNLVSADYWCNVKNGTYYFKYNTGETFTNYPANYGLVIKLGQYSTDGTKKDFRVIFFAQTDGTIYNLSGNASSTTCVWREIYNDKNDSGWINLSLASGISTGSQGGTPQYRKIGKQVFIRGGYAGNKPSSGSITLATLPSGYRPKTQFYTFCPMTGQRVARCFVNTNGNINFEWAYDFNANGYTGNFGWLDVETSFFID